jgi:hypothetical protein
MCYSGVSDAQIQTLETSEFHSFGKKSMGQGPSGGPILRLPLLLVLSDTYRYLAALFQKVLQTHDILIQNISLLSCLNNSMGKLPICHVLNDDPERHLSPHHRHQWMSPYWHRVFAN